MNRVPPLIQMVLVVFLTTAGAFRLQSDYSEWWKASVSFILAAGNLYFLLDGRRSE